MKNLTKLVKEHNKKNSSKKDLSAFFANESTKKLIQDLSIKLGGIDNVLITKRGKYGYTTACDELYTHCYNWLNHIPNRFFDRDELEFVKLLQRIFDDVLKIETQKQCGVYKIDIYIPRLNMAIEYDEAHHDYNLYKDMSREEFIKKELNCDFLRVKKGQELDVIPGIINTFVSYVIDDQKNK